MAGVASATLRGCVIAAIPTFWWDHTYVESTCGLKWGCFGRDGGGNLLASGTGSSIIADCLSQPNSEAGISYRKTGVCHQAANRILHPAGVTVANCRGYAVSVFRYNTYGKGAWPQLSNCYNITATIPPLASGRSMPQSRSSSSSV